MIRFAEVISRRRVEAMLNGIVNEKIAGYIIKSLGIKASEAAGLDAADITSICDMLKHMRFNIDGFGSYEDSQAASGELTHCSSGQITWNLMDTEAYTPLESTCRCDRQMWWI